MPRRPSIHLLGHSTTPLTSSSAINEGISAISRKFTTATHLETASLNSSTPPARRSSFSMDSILHPHKERRADSKERDGGRKDKRKSLAMRGPTKSKDRASEPSPRLVPIRPGKFEMIIESPPLIFYGNTVHSTGALLSGRLKLLVEDPTSEVKLEHFTMVLRAVIATKKPLVKECHDCRERINELNKWKFLSEPKTFRKDKDNQFPFSFLLPGHLAASTASQLGSIAYQLVAIATTSVGDVIDLVHPLNIQRAIAPGPDKASIRIFPPTNLTGRVVLPPVVHPIGKFPVQLTLSGVVEKKNDLMTRWRLRKVMWRIEETSKMISVPCSQHNGKISSGKGIQNVDVKIVGNEEAKRGWKTDFDTAGGEILYEFEAALNTKINHKAVCDVDSAAGLEVKHNLIVELIVAEEFCPIRNSNLITPTGAARVLRMNFAIIVTQRAGMGISWDEEMPPMYEDVPDSPPGYGSADKNDGAFGGAIIEDYEGPELEYHELERLHTENPNDPPIYRERDPATLINQGLPMRSPAVRPTTPQSYPSPQISQQTLGEPSVPRASGRTGRWTEDDFADPPQYALRRETTESSEDGVEDVGQGDVE